jgi:hypothetical protein
MGPKSVLERVEWSLGEVDDEFSDMIQEEEEMVQYTARKLEQAE